MNDQQRDVLKEHTYDGIQEYDNPTPGWWSLIFIATIVFSIGYFAVLFNHEEFTVAATYESAVTEATMKQFAALGELRPDAATLLDLGTNPQQSAWLNVGRAVFQTNCASCHGRDAAGLTGPNLTDDRYIHVRKIEDIVAVIRDGANNGAMPPWGAKLQTNEIVLVAAYVASLRGRNVAGRVPEGEAAPPWAAP